MAASTVARVAQMARILVALAAVLLPAAVADQAVTQTETALPGYFSNYGMVLKLNPAEAGYVTNQYSVVPLTADVGLNTTNFTTLNSISYEGALVTVDQSNYNTFNDSTQIAYMSCDSNTDQSFISPSDVLNGLMGNPTKPAAILLYTTNVSQVYCSLQGSNLAYTTVFSMVSSDDGNAVKNMTTRANGKVTATIDGKDADPSSNPNKDTSSGNNSAVAMSILYSITGLITLLFLIIIATGAVRAHRHPERYGPRASYGGRPRQSRARGLARAVLDTLPIVKFGDQPHPPAKGDPDQELESIAGDEMRARRSDEWPTAAGGAVGTEPASQSRATSAGSAPAANGTTENNTVGDEHLGCTICTEDFTVGEDVRVLPCDHKFHPACIDPWLVNVSGTCPLCRLDLRPQEESRDSSELPSFNADGEAAQDASPENVEGRRRSRLLDWNRLRHASVDERIHALRQMRQQRRTTDPGSSAEDGAQQASLTDRLRERFHIRTRTQS